MKINDFTQNPEVFHLIEKLKKDGIDKKEFSDLLDKNNNQYVELVQEGGGRIRSGFDRLYICA